MVGVTLCSHQSIRPRGRNLPHEVPVGKWVQINNTMALGIGGTGFEWRQAKNAAVVQIAVYLAAQTATIVVWFFPKYLRVADSDPVSHDQ